MAHAVVVLGLNAGKIKLNSLEFMKDPEKYMIDYYGNDEFYVKLLGMPHGLLFMSYVVFAIIFRKKFNWSSKSFLIILSASVIPFGTFYIDKKYLRNIDYK